MILVINKSNSGAIHVSEFSFIFMCVLSTKKCFCSTSNASDLLCRATNGHEIGNEVIEAAQTLGVVATSERQGRNQ
jgi:hypothetical protein